MLFSLTHCTFTEAPLETHHKAHRGSADWQAHARRQETSAEDCRAGLLCFTSHYIAVSFSAFQCSCYGKAERYDSFKDQQHTVEIAG